MRVYSARINLWFAITKGPGRDRDLIMTYRPVPNSTMAFHTDDCHTKTSLQHHCYNMRNNGYTIRKVSVTEVYDIEINGRELPSD